MPKFLCKTLLLFLALFIFFANSFAKDSADDIIYVSSFQYVKDIERPKPLTALTEVIAINVVVHTFDRFILKEDFAQVSFKDIGNNFKKGFVWDNDDFSMNTFFHPYHGSLYFNSARANGLSFWQSVPYTFAGSFMWEFFGEKSYPAINDFINTSIAGAALGEMMHRISYLVLDDSKSGIERTGREILAGIISPMDLFNRLINGKTSHKSFREEEHRDSLKDKFYINLSLFNRHMIDLDNNRDKSNYAFAFSAIYGDPFTYKEKRLPYDFFIADVNFNIIGNQPLISEVSVIGLLSGKQWEKDSRTFLAGIFQHFDYYNSNSLKEGSPAPYEFAETASFGGGIYMKKQNDENTPPVFFGHLHANLILLGESESDYYSVYERNYNFGSGYSVKFAGMVHLSKHLNAFINLKTYQIFTLNNDDKNNTYDSVYDEHNTRGNASKTLLHMGSLGLGYRFNEDWSISLEQRFFSRKSNYKYFENVSTNSTETRLKVTYSIFN